MRATMSGNPGSSILSVLSSLASPMTIWAALTCLADADRDVRIHPRGCGLRCFPDQAAPGLEVIR